MLTTNQNIVRQKANYEKVCDFKTSGCLYFPREDLNGAMYVVSQSGEIFFFNEGTSEQVYTINGQPNCICFDAGSFYMAEQSTCAVYYKSLQNDNSTVVENILVKEFDDNPFIGPTSLCYDKEDNTLYIADAGNFSSSGLFPNNGSLYMIDLDSKIMKPVLYNCLHYPSDILLADNGVIYIAETFANRVTRLVQNPYNVFNASVFYQFNGRLGPTALSLGENGNIYVARYEYQYDLEQECDGVISIINPSGELIGELILPKLPEITGLLIPNKKRENLYLTEKNSNGVIKVKLSSFISELDKMAEENNTKYN